MYVPKPALTASLLTESATWCADPRNVATMIVLAQAYFYGFWKNKRIVLYDTILQQVDKDGILAILAHELGNPLSTHTTSHLRLLTRPSCACVI